MLTKNRSCTLLYDQEGTWYYGRRIHERFFVSIHIPSIFNNKSALVQALHEFLLFGLKQARACVFAGSFFALLFLSHHITFGMPRYDFLFVAAVLIQIVLVITKIETWDEVKVIFLFHILGLCLEIFKTNPAIGSWSYPEFGYLKVFNVPLYSGFMYAAVGSYISQSWRVMQLRMINFPSYKLSALLSAAIYLNFFTHHFIYDFRWVLAGLVVILFSKTTVEFVVTNKKRYLPLVASFVMIAFFIWIAENISTFLGAWKYPDQLITWTTVSIHKLGSWSLLVIISFMLIAGLKHAKEDRAGR